MSTSHFYQRKNNLDILDEYAKQPLGDKKQQLSVTYKAYRALKDEYEKVKYRQ